MKQSTEFIINSLIFIFFLKNSIIKITIYEKHKKQKTGNTFFSISLGPFPITKVTKGVIVSNTLNNTMYFVFSILKKYLIKFISTMVKHMAEISNNTKNIKKKNGDITTPFKPTEKLFLIFSK